MGIVFMIVAGTAIGWLAAVMSRIEDITGGARLHVASGIAGALVAGLLVNPLLGTGSLIVGPYTVPALVVSLIGAIAAISAIILLHSRKKG